MSKLAEDLARHGWRITDIVVNRSGRLVHRLDQDNLLSVAMFASDSFDLAAERATLEEIIDRNRGADLADPWPFGPAH